MSLVLCGFAIIFGRKPGEVLPPVFLAAIGLAVVPAFLAGVTIETWTSQPALLTVIILICLAVGIALLRAKWAKSLPIRSGGGKAVPIPRRWR